MEKLIYRASHKPTVNRLFALILSAITAGLCLHSALQVNAITGAKPAAHDAARANGVGSVNPLMDSSQKVAAVVCTTNPVVANSNDSGAGSLRDAITIACDGSTVTFSAAFFISGPYTITLTSGDLLINKNLTINGPTTAKVTISGNNSSRVFNVSAGLTFTLTNLTFANGQASSGGAINNLGNLVIGYSTFTANGATLSPGEGGAINSGGGTVKIFNSTFSGNQSNSSGGALFNGGNSQTTLTNTTITNNSANAGQNSGAGGGGIAQTSSLPITLNNTIVAGNSAVFEFDVGQFTVVDDDVNCQIGEGGAVDSNSMNNLIGSDTGLVGITSGTNGNLIGTAEAPINPLLGPLADNGGPTMTHRPQPFSSAIDAGNNASAVDQNNQQLTTDQRGPGFARIVNGIVDIGSVEIGNDLGVTKAGPATVAIDNNLTYTITVSSTGPTANATMTDVLPAGLTFVSLTAPGGWSCTTPAVNAGGTVTCSNANFAATNGDVFTLVVHVSADVSPETQFSNTATITNNSATDPNSQNNSSTATTTAVPCVVNPVVTSNGDSAPGSLRDAIMTACSGATITFDTSQIFSPIFLTDGELFIDKNLIINGPTSTELTISGNTSSRVFNIGGGLNVLISDLVVADGISNLGGGIYNEGTLTLTNATVSSNNATSNGGGIYNEGSLLVSNSTISGNGASANGGGIYNGGVVVGNILTMVNSTISGNNAVASGGGIYVNSGSAELTNVTISNNRTDVDDDNTGSGGGIFISAGTLSLKNTIVAGNFKGAAGSTLHDISGAVNPASSYNLIGTGANMTGISDGSNGNHVGTSNAPINALLAPLAFNGGVTKTHALLYNSPAIDIGNDCVFNNSCEPSLSTDQRGLSRQADGNLTPGAVVDIGAYERQSIESRTVPIGDNVSVDLNDAQLTFANVSGGGSDKSPPALPQQFVFGPSVSIQLIDPLAQTLPAGYSATGPGFGGAGFDITTNAIYTPPVGICFYLPAVTDSTTFGHLKILHKEGNSGTAADWIDRTIGISRLDKLVCGQVQSFSFFVVAVGAVPTAANGDVSGRILDGDGNPVAGTAIRLTGTQNRLTITDANGQYHFDNVETSGFYTVTPARANYSFTPTQRSFSQLGQHTDAAFTASLSGGSTVNPLDTTEFFVRQQYLDFLNREPDEPGFTSWVNNLNNCAAGDTTCDRLHVSEMFFRSSEFQDRGYYIYRFYSTAFGRKPDFAEFTPDIAQVSGFLTTGQLEAAKMQFVIDFTRRSAFAAVYDSLSNAAYVDTLINTAQITLSNRPTIIDALNSGAIDRAQALRLIAESSEVYRKYYNQAFVVMEYFGYLRRDPDALYLNWIEVLNQSGDARHMVGGFVDSSEYRSRFLR